MRRRRQPRTRGSSVTRIDSQTSRPRPSWRSPACRSASPPRRRRSPLMTRDPRKWLPRQRAETGGREQAGDQPLQNERCSGPCSRATAAIRGGQPRRRQLSSGPRGYREGAKFGTGPSLSTTPKPRFLCERGERAHRSSSVTSSAGDPRHDVRRAPSFSRTWRTGKSGEWLKSLGRERPQGSRPFH